MNQNIPKLDNAELMKKALVELRETKAKLQNLEKEKTEPIAIIGMGCRFPSGANNPGAFWDLLSQGKDGISEVPKNRWNIDDYYDSNRETPGKMYTRYGGFVENLQEFDANFFGITPREANFLDPQQRLLLEVTWEAIENAAINPQRLAKTQTGVFVGISGNDYSQLLCSQEATEIDSYFGTGNAHSSAAGRLSYFLGLTGPSLAVDTACSSSLVTVHLASLSLRNRESDLAIVGGVNRIITPELSINFSKARMLSADGRCKTFDASADGFVRGEGCGIIILKRLSDAIADGDNILAVIRGSAVNQDGHTSGLTVPNGPSQQAVIRKALENAGVNPGRVSYIEAHGTGTSLGDPIEVVALGGVFAKSHSQEKPLIIGSVKTNIGHLEAAAGIAGLIKVVLQLQHQKIPPHLHFQTPNPYIDWSQLPLQVPTKMTPWQEVEGQTLIAGISSFSFSGTNAHIVLEQAPIVSNEQKSLEKLPLDIFILGAKTQSALEELITSYQNHLEVNPELELADICYSANTGRANFGHRLAVVAASKEELNTKLSQAKLGELSPGVLQKPLPSSTKAPKIAFLFTGQGSQYINMGRQLYETQPVFRQALDNCQQILSAYLDKPLLSVLYPSGAEVEENKQLLDETVYTQPALFAIEYALVQLWQSWGIKPDAVAGHSVGEYVAACVAGVFSLEDALKLIAYRGKLMQQLPPTGEMVAVMAGSDLINSLISGYSQQVAIAAFNGPSSTVISGSTPAIRAICQLLSDKGIKFKKLEVSHAFHSPLMQPMLADFEVVANQVSYNRPKIPIISNVTGQKADNRISTPQYWLNHILQPVRFADSIACLHQLGYETYLEIGPRPILLAMARQCFSEDIGVWLPSIRPGVDDWQQILQSLAQLYLEGVAVDWSGFYRPYSCCKVVLPTYPFQRKRFWVESSNRKPQKVESRLEVKADVVSSSGVPELFNHVESATQSLDNQVEYKALPNLPVVEEKQVTYITYNQNKIVGNKVSQRVVQQQLAIMSQQLETLRANRLKGKQLSKAIAKNESASNTSLIAYHQPRPNARLRLFCFHELGGSAYIFRQWADNLPPEIEVVPFELPGREGNSQEQLFANFATVVQSLEKVLTAYLDKPFAIWGQSLGAFIGFELAHLLCQRYGIKPIQFFVGGAWTPGGLISNLKTMLSLSQEEILNRFLKTLEMPQSSQVNESLMEIILGRLNADIKLLLSYKPIYSQGQPLDCPIFTFGGLEDSEVREDELSKWSQYTLGAFKLKMIPGRHGSFLSNNQVFIWNTISESLSLYQDKVGFRKLFLK